MKNLKEETLEMMNMFNKTVEDIAWIGGRDFSVPVDLFFKLADVEYDDDYGAQEIAYDLKIVFKDNTAFYRHSYDGKEWWNHISLVRPSVERDDISTLCSDKYLLETLRYMNQ